MSELNFLDTGGNKQKITTPVVNSMAFNTANTERVRITSGGNVNIGGDYTNSDYRLSVTGGSSKQMKVVGQEADIWLESTGGSSTFWRILGSTGGSTHRFRIYDQTNGSERFSIDNSGIVHEPAMPFGVMHGTTAWVYNNNGAGHYLLGNTNSSSGGGNGSDTQLNIGWTASGAGATNNNFTASNGIWTAPIAGYYSFSMKLYALMNSNDYIQIKPSVNGSHLSETIYGYQQGNGTYCEGINETVNYYLNANDTFSWNAYGPNNAWRIYGAHCECSGYLVRGAG